MYFVYIVECADGSLYTGITTDIQKRIREHNGSKAGARYTKTRRPVALRYVEEHPTRSGALRRESEIKSWRKDKKWQLLAAKSPARGKHKKPKEKTARKNT